MKVPATLHVNDLVINTTVSMKLLGDLKHIPFKVTTPLILETEVDLTVPMPGISSVYLIRGDGNNYKIGFGNPLQRLRSLQTGNPYPLRLIACCPGGKVLENKLHDKYKNNKIQGEWFNLVDDDVSFIKKIMAIKYFKSRYAEDTSYWDDISPENFLDGNNTFDIGENLAIRDEPLISPPLVNDKILSPPVVETEMLSLPKVNDEIISPPVTETEILSSPIIVQQNKYKLLPDSLVKACRNTLGGYPENYINNISVVPNENDTYLLCQDFFDKLDGKGWACLSLVFELWGCRGGLCWMDKIKEWAYEFCDKMRLIPIYENTYIEFLTGLIIYINGHNISCIGLCSFFSIKFPLSGSAYCNKDIITEILCDVFGITYNKQLIDRYDKFMVTDGKHHLKDLTYVEISKLHHTLINLIPPEIRITINPGVLDLFQSRADKINSIKSLLKIDDKIRYTLLRVAGDTVHIRELS